MSANKWVAWNDRQPRFQTADDFQFSEPKIEAGWFDISLTCLGKKYDFAGSYLGEPFVGFLSSVLDLHAYFEGTLISDSASEFDVRTNWQGEPWRYDWRFWPRTEGREVNIRLVHHSDTPRLDLNPNDQVETWFEVCVPCSVLLQQWYEVGKAILMAFGLIGYRNAWIDSEFPLRNFRDLHEAVTGTEFNANSVEDDIRFLTLFTKGTAGTMPPPAGLQGNHVSRDGSPERFSSGRVCKRTTPNGQALLAHWDEEYQELKADADRKRTQGIAPQNAPRVPPEKSAFVFIVDAEKTPILVYCVEQRNASAFAVARLKDLMNGSRESYSYRIVE